VIVIILKPEEEREFAMKMNAFLNIGASATLALALGATLVSPAHAMGRGFHARERYEMIHVPGHNHNTTQYLKDTNKTTDWHTTSTDVKEAKISSYESMSYWQLSVDEKSQPHLPGQYILRNVSGNPVEADINLNLPQQNASQSAKMSIHIDKEGNATITHSDVALPPGQYAFMLKPAPLFSPSAQVNQAELGYRTNALWENPDFTERRNNQNLIINGAYLVPMQEFNQQVQYATQSQNDFENYQLKIASILLGGSAFLATLMGLKCLKEEKEIKAKKSVQESSLVMGNNPMDKIQSMREDAFKADKNNNLNVNKNK
jgi:hypothetical protein